MNKGGVSNVWSENYEWKICLCSRKVPIHTSIQFIVNRLSEIFLKVIRFNSWKPCWLHHVGSSVFHISSVIHQFAFICVENFSNQVADRLSNSLRSCCKIWVSFLDVILCHTFESPANNLTKLFINSCSSFAYIKRNRYEKWLLWYYSENFSPCSCKYI